MQFLLVFLRSFRAALSSISPLVFLGFARIISTSGVDYQVLFLFLCVNYVHYQLLIQSFIIIATCPDMEPTSCVYAIRATFCCLFAPVIYIVMYVSSFLDTKALWHRTELDIFLRALLAPGRPMGTFPLDAPLQHRNKTSAASKIYRCNIEKIYEKSTLTRLTENQPLKHMSTRPNFFGFQTSDS